MTATGTLPSRVITLEPEPGLGAASPHRVLHVGAQGVDITKRPDGTYGTKQVRNDKESKAVPKSEIGHILLKDPHFWEIAHLLPGNARRPGQVGSPRNYPDWVFLFLMVMATAHGTQSAAIREVCEATSMWRAYRRTAHKHLPEGFDKARRQAPKYHHIQYFLKRWKSEAWAPIRAEVAAGFRRVAIGLATDLGHLPTGEALFYKRPCPSQWVVFDGTVSPGPTKNRPGKGHRHDPASGWHNKYGQEKTRVWGSKIVFASLRSDDYHGRVILDFQHVLGPNNISGIGDEGRAIVNVAKRIHADAPGMRGVIADGVLRDVHITELSADNLHTINHTAAARNPQRKTKGTHNSSRVEKRHKVTVFRHTRVNGRTCEHHIWAIGGRLHERLRSGANGQPVWVPLEHDRVSSRPNADGTTSTPPSNATTCRCCSRCLFTTSQTMASGSSAPNTCGTTRPGRGSSECFTAAATTPKACTTRSRTTCPTYPATAGLSKNSSSLASPSDTTP